VLFALWASIHYHKCITNRRSAAIIHHHILKRTVDSYIAILDETILFSIDVDKVNENSYVGLPDRMETSTFVDCVMCYLILFAFAAQIIARQHQFFVTITFKIIYTRWLLLKIWKIPAMFFNIYFIIQSRFAYCWGSFAHLWNYSTLL